MKYTVFCVFFIFWNPVVFAKKFALTVSEQKYGSDDLKLRQPTLEKATTFFAENGYISTVLANTPVKYSTQASLVSAKNFEKSIDDIIFKVGPGDQVVLNLLVHGEGGPDKEHMFVFADGSYPMSKVKEAVKRLESKGAKVAILDQACYSGASLELASEKTCVVAASSEREVSLIYFNDSFWNVIKKNQNVEEVFTLARGLDLKSAAYPMISTPEGREVSSVLLNYTQMAEVVHHQDLAKLPPTSICTDQSSLADRLLNTFSDLKDINVQALGGTQIAALKASALKIVDIEDKKREEALKIQSRNQAAFAGMQKMSGVKTGVFLHGAEITLNALATTDFEKVIAVETEVLAKYELSEGKRAALLSSVAESKAAILARDERKKSDPEFALLVDWNFDKVARASIDAEKKVKISTLAEKPSFASDMIARERKVYSELYAEAKKGGKNRSSVCRDFKF